MTKGLIGADVAALRQLAAQFDREADTLNAAITTVSRGVQSQFWTGPVAVRFRGTWVQTHNPRLAQTVQALHDNAKILRRNADQQETTSNSDGGPAHGGGGRSIAPGTPTDKESGWGQGDVDDYDHPLTDNLPSEKNSPAVVDLSSPWRVSAAKSWGTPDDPGSSASKPNDLVEGNLAIVNGSISKTWGVEEEVSGSFGSEDSFHGSGSASAWAGAQAEGNAGVNLTYKEGEFNLEAGASGKVAVGAGVEASGEIDWKVLHGEGQVEAFVGASASADASVSIGTDGFEAHGGVEAFAGVSASAEGSIGIDGLQVGGEATVQVGVGLTARGDFEASWEKVSADFELGAALGIGFDFHIKIDIEPKKIWNDIIDWFGF
jgi:uncharacterized protein YukE